MLKDFYVIGYFSKPKNLILKSLDSIADEKHLTVLPQFSMESEKLPEFTEKFMKALVEINDTRSVEYPVKTVGSETFTGPNGSVSVQLVEKTIEIEELHLMALSIVKELEGTFTVPAFSGDGYNPHISHADEGFVSELTHVGITTYQEEPFQTEILSLFDLSVSSEVDTAA